MELILTKENLVEDKNCSHLQFPGRFTPLVRETRSSLSKDFSFLNQVPEVPNSRLGGWGWKMDPEFSLKNPVFH